MTTFAPTARAALQVRGAGFWVQLTALVIDFLIPTIPGTAIVFARPEWGGVWVPLTLALTFVYLALFTAGPGAVTVGMKIFGLRAMRLDGRPLGAPLAAWRAFLVMCSVALLGLGVLAIAFDERRQGWHDHWTSTVVVHEAAA